LKSFANRFYNYRTKSLNYYFQYCSKSLKLDCHINYKGEGDENSGQVSSDVASSIMSQLINLLSSDTGNRATNSTRDNFKVESCSDIKQKIIETGNDMNIYLCVLGNICKFWVLHEILT